MITFQDLSAYTKEDHQTWNILHTRQLKDNFPHASREYQKGFHLLDIKGDTIVDIYRMSEKLQPSGWTLVPVTGLIPTRDFFYMLVDKKYPVTVPIRKPHKLDFSDSPDIFHDVYGHIPLLTHEQFDSYLTGFSAIALKYIDNEEAVELLGRLYWYTFEMGFIMEDNEIKPYGGAVLTSQSEMENAKSDTTRIHAFSTEYIFDTPFNSNKLQGQYFIIDSFDDLFNSLHTLESDLKERLGVKSVTCQVSHSGGN